MSRCGISIDGVRARRALLLALLLPLLAACTRLYFAPVKQWALTPDRIGLAYQDLALQTADGVAVHAWLLPASAPQRGRVLYLHGNGENISTHLASVYWLPAAGYDVLLLDYRGYGRSAGVPSLPEVLLDIDAGWQALQRTTRPDSPAFVFAQSLGAAMAYQWLSLRKPAGVAAVIYDSGFARYPHMVRKVLASAWLTRWLATPLSWCVSRRHDPEREAAAQPAVPRLFLHSRDDVIVPWEQGEALYRANTHQACLLEGRGPHIQMVQQQQVRQNLVAFLADPAGWLAHCDTHREQLRSTQPEWIPLPPVR